MNTRLQVEHPVTEMITGHDLVEWQLRVASGQPLPVTQSDLSIDGWAFEARLYAEDAERGFLPATGTLKTLHFPRSSDSIRIDTGVRAGDTITPFYDPMIAKIIVKAETRQAALNSLTNALADCHIAGTITNARFLHVLSRQSGFAAGDVDTGLIERHHKELIAKPACPLEAVALAALAALDWPGQNSSESSVPVDVWQRLGGWRLWDPAQYFVTLIQEKITIDVTITASNEPNSYEINWADQNVSVSLSNRDQNLIQAVCNGHKFTARTVQHGDLITIFIDGAQYAFTIPDLLAGTSDEAAAADRIAAPMPGLIKVLNVIPGDAVQKGDAVMIMEAMKMEYTLTAPRYGTIGEITANAGDQVEEAVVLLTMSQECSPKIT